MAVRKNYRGFTNVERDRFVQALYHVKSTGVVDQFAELHNTHFSHGPHRSSHFLPWHREFLRRFENALRTHHPDITIPYWDWTVDRSPSDPLWSNTFLGQFDSAWGLRRALGSGNLPTSEQVERIQRESNTYDDFWPRLEGIHDRPHGWVGGVMAGGRSPGDPVFYLHHCWIDLLWARWQVTHRDAPFVSSGAGFGLNDPLAGWPDRTAANVINHYALGYRYDREVMAGSYAQRVAPLTTVNVALPPAEGTGAVKFGATFLSLGTDFGTAVVRLAIGRPGNFRIEDNLQVPVGRQVVRRLRNVDQVASIVHQSGSPISVLVEFET